MSRPVILTGIRANNDLTLGNYLGALLPLVDMAKTRSGEYAVHLFVPDLHSFTTPAEHGKLYQQTLENLRVYAAAGLPLDDPNVHIYRQSYIPAHSELTWILDCFTGFGEMSRMTQFKDKSGRIDHRQELKHITERIKKMSEEHGEHYTPEMAAQSFSNLLNALHKFQEHGEKESTVGLFNYPVLMAADILLYGAAYVPVGEDQTQHLEFARDIAERMNNQFGRLFVVPEPVAQQHEFFGKEQGLRIRDLQDPTKKMSKSDDTGKGVIFLSDSVDAAVKKIMSAATDSFGEIRFNMTERPGVSNLLQILALLGNRPLEQVTAEWANNPSYGDFKKAVAGQVEVFLLEFQKRLSAVDMNAVLAKLAADERHMNDIANATLRRVQQAVGLRPGA